MPGQIELFNHKMHADSRALCKNEYRNLLLKQTITTVRRVPLVDKTEYFEMGPIWYTLVE